MIDLLRTRFARWSKNHYVLNTAFGNMASIEKDGDQYKVTVRNERAEIMFEGLFKTKAKAQFEGVAALRGI